MRLNPAFETNAFMGAEYVVIHQIVGRRIVTVRLTPQQASALGVELLRLGAQSNEWSPVAKAQEF